MDMSKVKFEKLTSAGIKTTNALDESRTYSIEANVNIKDGNVLKSIEAGYVRKNGMTMCTFSKYGNDNLNTNFQNVGDIMVMCGILQAVDAFIGEVTQKVSEGNSVVLKD